MEPNELAEGSENLFLRTLSNNDTPKNCEERNRDGDNTDFIEKKDEKCFNNELKDDIMLIDQQGIFQLNFQEDTEQNHSACFGGGEKETMDLIDYLDKEFGQEQKQSQQQEEEQLQQNTSYEIRQGQQSKDQETKNQIIEVDFVSNNQFQEEKEEEQKQSSGVQKCYDLLNLNDSDQYYVAKQQQQSQETQKPEEDNKQESYSQKDHYLLEPQNNLLREPEPNGIQSNLDPDSDWYNFNIHNETKKQEKINQIQINNNNFSAAGEAPIMQTGKLIIEEDDSEIDKKYIAETDITSFDLDYIIKMSDQEMHHRVVLVSEPELIAEGYITTYKLYRIKSKEQGQINYQTEVLRRFSDFEWLFNDLINQYGGYLIPLLPEKNILTKFNVETNNFTKHRQRSLEFFLQKLLDHPKLHSVTQLKMFICAKNEMFSLIKGEAESKKTIEDKYQNMLGSVKNYFQSNLGSLFGSNQTVPSNDSSGTNSNNNTSTASNSNNNNLSNSSGVERDQSEIDRELNEYERQFSNLSSKVKQLIKVCQNQSSLIEEEIKGSNLLNYNFSLYQIQHSSQQELNDQQNKNKETLIKQDIINLKEDALFQWQIQFEPQLEVWFRNCLAAEEALNRRKELINQVLKDSKRIQELSLLNKKNNNQRDTEMDILQNNLSKNKIRLEKINETLVNEIQAFNIEQQEQFSNILNKFKEIYSDLYSKQNDIYQGRIPSLL